MISLFFILLVTWFVHEDRKMPKYLRAEATPLAIAVLVTLYIILLGVMVIEIAGYCSLFGGMLLGILSAI